MCGEKTLIRLVLFAVLGSPPRMRGKVLFKTLGEGTFGITPAYAGKRLLPLPVCLHRRDHPRVCGEKAHMSQPAPKA